MPITEHTIKTARQTTFYLAAGPENGPLVIFVHGWPELSVSWRHQLPALAALGFRTIVPDMRGYGRSSVYSQHAAYAQEHIVRDMIELLDFVGREKAVWVGHDWGARSCGTSPVIIPTVVMPSPICVCPTTRLNVGWTSCWPWSIASCIRKTSFLSVSGITCVALWA